MFDGNAGHAQICREVNKWKVGKPKWSAELRALGSSVETRTKLKRLGRAGQKHPEKMLLANIELLKKSGLDVQDLLFRAAKAELWGEVDQLPGVKSYGELIGLVRLEAGKRPMEARKLISDCKQKKLERYFDGEKAPICRIRGMLEFVKGPLEIKPSPFKVVQAFSASAKASLTIAPKKDAVERGIAASTLIGILNSTATMAETFLKPEMFKTGHHGQVITSMRRICNAIGLSTSDVSGPQLQPVKQQITNGKGMVK
ncbi:MAG: hypothetical protein Q7S34_02105 [bacterium]|nr:hypothetical protein [bacterium]